MLLDELKKLDLNEKEAMSYIACLEMGPSTLLELSKKTGLNRVTLYSVVDKLIDKKLISLIIKGKKKIYTAEPPDKIKNILKEKLDIYGTILPELVSLTDKTKARPKIKYLEGVEGIKEAYKFSLLAKESILKGIIGVEALIQKSKALEYFWQKEYIPKRKEKEKFVQAVVPDNQAGKDFRNFDKKAFRETRLLPASTYNFKCDLFVYDNISTATSYSQGEEFALVVESGPIAETIRMVWQVCWNSAR